MTQHSQVQIFMMLLGISLPLFYLKTGDYCSNCEQSRDGIGPGLKTTQTCVVHKCIDTKYPNLLFRNDGIRTY